jgi:glutathione S-transferase
LPFVRPEAGLAPPLTDPARGRYLQWLFFSPGCIEQAFLAKVHNVSMRPEAAGFGEFDRVFDVLEEAVAAGPWLLGEWFSAADVMIGADLHFGIDIFKLVYPRPALRAYVARCLARPAFQRAKAIDAAGMRGQQSQARSGASSPKTRSPKKILGAAE